MNTLGYKEEKRYHPKHFQNLERLGKNIRKQRYDPINLLKIDLNDEEEKEARKYLGMYIQSLGDHKISPQTARI